MDGAAGLHADQERCLSFPRLGGPVAKAALPPRKIKRCELAVVVHVERRGDLL